MTRQILMLTMGLVMVLCSLSAFSLEKEDKLPTVAVSNFAYQKDVRDYFFETESHFNSKTNSRQKADKYTQFESYKHEIEASKKSKATIKTKTDFKELKQFTADIKGELIKSAMFDVQESRPYTSNNEKIFDVIERIKAKNFSGADYVLFGTLNSIQSDESIVEIANTTSNAHQHVVTIQADFSLIETKSLKVIAAFSSVGNAQQTILMGKESVDIIHVNKGRLLADLSRDFAGDVIKQIKNQLTPSDTSNVNQVETRKNGGEHKNSEVRIYY